MFIESVETVKNEKVWNVIYRAADGAVKEFYVMNPARKYALGYVSENQELIACNDITEDNKFTFEDISKLEAALAFNGFSEIQSEIIVKLIRKNGLYVPFCELQEKQNKK